MTIGGARPRPAGLALQDPPLPQTRGAGRTIWEDRNMKKRLISWLLILALCVSILPAATLAAEPEDTALTGAEQTVDPAETEPESDPAEAKQAITPAEPVRAVSANSEGTTHTHFLCGETDACNKEGHDEGDNKVTFTAWPGISNVVDGGAYYLTESVGSFTVPNGVNLTLCLNGFYISQASSNDPAVTVKPGATFTLCDCKGSNADGGSITHSSRDNKYGIGVYVGERASAKNTAIFNMYSGTISYNTSIDGVDGGGVTVMGGTFNMYGGTISYNRALSGKGIGGGVFVANQGTFNMSGGTIANNQAISGGGVFVGGSYTSAERIWFNGTFNMSGGSITGNTAGGGVYVNTYSTQTIFRVSGTAEITGNLYDSKNRNVYLPSEHANKATIEVGTLDSSASIGVTTQDVDQLVATGVSTAAKKCFSSDSKSYTLKYSGAAKTLTMVKATTTHTDHPVCGDAGCKDHEILASWTGISDLSKITQNGNYYLTDDVELDATGWTCGNNTVKNVTLCLNGHSITRNGTEAAIALSTYNGITLNLCDCVGGGEIMHGTDANGETYTGAGVSVPSTQTFNMYGGTITGNKNTFGGGVRLGTGATFNMYGGTITRNKANNDNGGGVNVAGGATFNMHGGSITKNDAANGGGVCAKGISSIDSYANFNMYGGTITENTATTRGGGVYVDVGTFKMSGGSITENTAKTAGGVYYYSASNSLFVSGNVNIMGNKDTDGKANNVYVPSSSGTPKTVPFYIGQDGLAEEARIGVRVNDGVIGTGEHSPVAQFAPQANMTSAYHDGNFLADNGGVYGFKLEAREHDTLTSTHVVNLYNGLPHKHPICGETCTDGTHTENLSWKGIANLSEITGDGYYYLTQDVETTGWTVPTTTEGVNLCLNGHKITSTAATAITVNYLNTFTLTDCNGENKVYHFSDDSSQWKLAENGKQEITGGVITYTGSGSGNAVGVAGEGKFYMYGGTICGNSSSGVTVKSKATFTMHGGAIKGNISSSSSSNGGGVYAEGKFTMTGGVISHNATSGNGYGGGVYASSTFNMSGNAVISNNTASGRGGGVYAKGTTFTMSNNASVSGNTTTGSNGGGVYVDGISATFTMSDNASVSGNTAALGGGVYMNSYKSFTMSGGSITGNTAGNGSTGEGGGVCVVDGTFTMTGGKITGNNVTLGSDASDSQGGGGVYVYKNDTVMRVSGDVQITDNWKNGTKNGDVYERGSGSANNVYLFRADNGSYQKTVTIDSTMGLASTAKIGVTTRYTPTASNPIQFATGAQENVDYTGIFTPDVTDYTVTKDGTTLYLSAHEHHWKYEKAANGEEIMVSCDADGCDLNGQKIYYTLRAPATSTLTYDGNGKPAKVSVSPSATGVTLPTPSSISYVKAEPYQQLENGAEPTNAGTYYASVTVGTETATVKYTIAPARLLITAKSTVIDYGSEPVNDGVEYQGFVNNETEAVLGGDLEFDHAYNRYGNVGDYDITPKGLTSRNYDITFLPGKLQVKPRLVTITWNNTTGRTYGDNGGEVTATANGTVNGDVIGVTVRGNELTVGDHTAIATGLTGEKADNYKLPTEDENKSVTYTVGRAAQTLTFALGDQTKTYGDPAFANAATNDRTDGAEVQYSSDDTNVATVDNDGKVTIVGAGTAKITATAPAVDDKYSAGSAEYTMTVSKKTLTADDLEFTQSSTFTKEYDGNTTCTTATVQIKSAAKVNQNDVLPTVTGTYAYDSKDVNRASKVTFTSAASDNTNYILPANLTVDHTASITKRVLTVGEVHTISKTYNTLDNALDCVTSIELSGTVSGETLRFYTSAETGGDYGIYETKFDNANAGQSKTITGTVALLESSALASNYTFKVDGKESSTAPFTATGEIKEAPGDNLGSVERTQKFTDENPKTEMIAWKQLLPAGQTWNYISEYYSASSVTVDHRTDDNGALTYTITGGKENDVVVFTVSAKCNNYNDFTYTVRVTLTARDSQALEFKGVENGKVTKTYGDQPFTQAVTGAETDVTYTSSDETVAKVDAQTGKVTIIGAGDAIITANAVQTNNYASASVSYTLTVNKLSIAVPTAGLNNKLEYNGKEQTYTPDELDTTYCSITGNTAKDVNSYTATVSLIDKANTEWDIATENDTSNQTYDFWITPARAIVTALDKKITTVQPAPELSNAKLGEDYTITGLYGSDSLGSIVLYYADPSNTAKEVNPDTGKAGTYAIVAKLDGEGNSNYILMSVPGTLTIEAVQTSQKLGISAPGRTPGGSYELTPKNAQPGDTVTISVSPDKGYELGDLTVRDMDGNELDLKRGRSGDYTFTMPRSSVSVSISFVREDDALFDDVFAGDYYYNAVQWAAEQGITGGVSKNLFAPDAACTRAQIVTFLWRAAGSPAPETMSAFADVPAGAYYAKAVAWAVENGITKGLSADAFGPDAPCTRAQAVTFLARALDATAEGAADFADVPADAYYAKPVAWAVEANVTNGVSKTQFAPNETCTRAQIVTFLYRAYKRMK